MSYLLFKNSESLTLGVELELQLINLSNFNLAPSSPDLLYLLGQKPFPGNVMPEIVESMIEVATGIHDCYEDLLFQLEQIRDVIVSAADRLNIGICGGGTHPFQHWSEQKIFSKPRFQKVSELYGYLAQQFTIFGQHIHIGCRNGDEALFLLHALNRYLPHFIALSGSSPFVQGKDTLFNSARLNSVFAFPFSGRAPFILHWDQFIQEYFSKMELTGVIKNMKDFYWDIRPKPEFGTIELRVCDTPLTVKHAAALACYLQVICQYLLAGEEELPAEDDYLVYNYNRFQACRFGLEGSIVHPKSYEKLLLREDIRATLHRMMPHAEMLNCVSALEYLEQMTYSGDDAQYLRQQHAEWGGIEGMVERALYRFRADM